MKSVTGGYYNIFSESGYDNYGLKLKFDIMIVFSDGLELDGYIIDELDSVIADRLKKLGDDNPYAKRDDVDAAIKQVLKTLGYEYEIILIKQGVTAAGMVKDDYKKGTAPR